MYPSLNPLLLSILPTSSHLIPYLFLPFPNLLLQYPSSFLFFFFHTPSAPSLRPISLFHSLHPNRRYTPPVRSSRSGWYVGQPGSWKRELFSQLSGRWIALRCWTAIRIDYSLPKLRRGPPRSYYTTRPRPSRVSRSRQCLDPLALSPSSQDHSRRARCLPAPLLDPSICKLSRARRHWPTRAVPPQGSSSFVGPANRPCPLPFSPTSTPRYSKYSISFLDQFK